MSTNDPANADQQPVIRTVTLTKRDQKFLFRYEAGNELALLDSLVEMVKRSDLPFDWFDAAVVAHQVGEHIAAELKGHLPQTTNDASDQQ